MSYGINLLVAGPRACFTRPELKSERVSYDVMTPSAARGILEAIHWKPAICWRIDAIRVLRPIQWASIRRNEVKSKISPTSVRSAIKAGNLDALRLDASDDRLQRATLYLRDVAYVISAHFDMTPRAGASDNPVKHLEMFQRRAASGQCFRQPVLGCSEFPADFQLIGEGDDLPKAIPETRDLGLMLWDIDHDKPGRPPAFFRAAMKSGVLRVPAHNSGEILR